MRPLHSPIALLLSALLALPGAAGARDIQVLGLFTGKAILRVDGSQRTLKSGETSPEGIRLISADSESALLEIDGEQHRFGLGSHIHTDYVAASGTEVTLWQDGSGMFRTVGSINGMPVNFLVDTGATAIAMNANEARRLGIDFRVVGTPGAATTASGVERIYHVKLDSVKLGEIQLRNIEAMVLEGDLPPIVLLGMSFLSRLDMQRQGQQLILKKKY